MIASRNPNEVDRLPRSKVVRLLQRQPQGVNHPARVAVALLTDSEIEHMSADELKSVIESADIEPIGKRVLRSLQPRSTKDLRRLVHATRTACQVYAEEMADHGAGQNELGNLA